MYIPSKTAVEKNMYNMGCFFVGLRAEPVWFHESVLPCCICRSKGGLKMRAIDYVFEKRNAMLVAAVSLTEPPMCFQPSREPSGLTLQESWNQPLGSRLELPKQSFPNMFILGTIRPTKRQRSQGPHGTSVAQGEIVGC